MRKIIIAFDSFKGSLSSAEANAACAEAARLVFPDCEIVQIPVADGGEGFAESLALPLGGKPHQVCVSGPLGDSVNANYYLTQDSQTAIMEMAQADGLTLVPESMRNPLESSSFGTGEMIADAIRHGARTIIIGLGGSATNDGGVGMLAALGVRFLDNHGNRLSGIGKDLANIRSIECSCISSDIRATRFIVASDVTNPLLGESGATHVFGAQKGADSYMRDTLEEGMRNFVSQVMRNGLPSHHTCPGAGAAGGLGFAFLSFLDAEIRNGIDIALEAYNFDETIQNADMIITGEGSIDAQTCHGKAAYGILSKAKKHNIPVIAIGGQIKDYDIISKAGFLHIASIINKPDKIDNLLDIDTAYNNLRQTTEQILNILKLYN